MSRSHDRDMNPPDVTRLLIDAARDDGPSPASLRKAKAAALLSLAGMGVTSTAAATGATLTLLKWFGIGALGTVAVLGAYQLTPMEQAPLPASPAAALGRNTPSAPVVLRSPPAVESAPPVSSRTAKVEPPPRREVVNPVVGAVEDADAEAAAQGPGLADEIARIDGARKALASGNADNALGELNAYAREHPRGLLSQEASFVRIQALLQQGKHGEAERLAKRMLQSHPSSPLAPRIRAVMGWSESGDSHR